jgi:hypothetical protein
MESDAKAVRAANVAVHRSVYKGCLVRSAEPKSQQSQPFDGPKWSTKSVQTRPYQVFPSCYSQARLCKALNVRPSSDKTWLHDTKAMVAVGRGRAIMIPATALEHTHPDAHTRQHVSGTCMLHLTAHLAYTQAHQGKPGSHAAATRHASHFTEPRRAQQIF